MRITDALNLLGLEGAADLPACEQAYRRAAMRYHPDRNPAGAEMMKAVNAAIEALRRWYADPANDPLRDHTNPTGYGDALNDALNAIIGIEELDIEICGSWIWVSGNTRAHARRLRKAGYRWGKEKQKWYYRPAGYKRHHSGTWSMERIREYHGSERPARQRRPRLGEDFELSA